MGAIWGLSLLVSMDEVGVEAQGGCGNRSVLDLASAIYYHRDNDQITTHRVGHDWRRQSRYGIFTRYFTPSAAWSGCTSSEEVANIGSASGIRDTESSGHAYTEVQEERRL